MELKQYQRDVLAILRRFLEQAQDVGPSAAYDALIAEPVQAERLGLYGRSYKPLPFGSEIPYVCLRVPTGGGKTLLSAHAIAVAKDAWMEVDYPMVLWLTPTNIIRAQTVGALRDSHHFYRQTLDEVFDGRVQIFDIADFTSIPSHVVGSQCCIVVGTIQTLRIGNIDGRKVYAHNESMAEHFSRLPKDALQLPELEFGEDGNVKYSFANLLHLYHPLMIVDEAHNAVTDLSRDMQAQVTPCAIIEFTATPRGESNVLHNVTAQELVQEGMIKLPIRLFEHDTWQSAVENAVTKRTELAVAATSEIDYVRPIVLFQAQKKNQEVTVATLKKYLVETLRVDERKIAIATGDESGLDGIDLFDRECPIECVITIEALKEGWDCSFAYVLCSVSRIRSLQSVEQLLGRVLRMPYAQRRNQSDLNYAYACLSEPDSTEAAKALVDNLVKMGFDEVEAQANIQRRESDQANAQQDEANHDDAQAEWFGEAKIALPFKISIAAGTSEIIARIKARFSDQPTAAVREIEKGVMEISITGNISDFMYESLKEFVPPSEQKMLQSKVAEHRENVGALPSPAQKGEKIKVPMLALVKQGELTLANTDSLMDQHEWSLLEVAPSPVLDADGFIQNTVREFEVGLEGKRVTWRHKGYRKQLGLDVNLDAQAPEILVHWLDGEIRRQSKHGISPKHQDISQSEMLEWLARVVHKLHNENKIAINELMHNKFILARKVRDKINHIREDVRKGVFKQCLLDAPQNITVSDKHEITFYDRMYDGVACYRGDWKPNKHFLGPDQVPAFDGGEEGEECKCAQSIDMLQQVKYWVRNVACHSASFWLPTAKGKFFPDFVAQLEDDRLLVVEYKGAYFLDSLDTKEKESVGNLWESSSKGQGLFLLAKKISEDGLEVAGQLHQKVSA